MFAFRTKILGRGSAASPDVQSNKTLKRIKTVVVGAALATGASLASPTTASAQICQVCVVTIQQVSSARFADAHEIQSQDFRMVTRPAQNNTTQLWRLTHLGNNTYTIQQMSNNRYVDAHEIQAQDYNMVTRPAQNNNTQRWFFSSTGSNIYTIQQVSSGRYVDAHEIQTEDYRMVTRPAQNNDTQRWRVVVVFTEPPQPPQQPPQPPAPVVHSSGNFELTPSFRVNLDTGNLGMNGADIFYQSVNFTELQLAPVNGAQISYTNGAQRGFAGCSAAAYSNTPVPQAAVAVGHYVCVRTNEGRISEFRVNNIGPVLRVLSISYTTWQ
jgi:hypothetical protein